MSVSNKNTFWIFIKEGKDLVKLHVPPLTVKQLHQVYKSLHSQAKGFQISAIIEINSNEWIWATDDRFHTDLLKSDGIYKLYIGMFFFLFLNNSYNYVLYTKWFFFRMGNSCT
jgi:hypothetical protein